MEGWAASPLLCALAALGLVCGGAWPWHTACREGALEVRYQSCDPLQDFGFSIDQCSRQVRPNLSIRFGIVLREDITTLVLEVALFSGGASILNLSYPVCQEDMPTFSFCGRRKGEQVYYAGPVDNPAFEVPSGQYALLLRLYDGTRALLACANATVTSS